MYFNKIEIIKILRLLVQNNFEIQKLMCIKSILQKYRILYTLIQFLL